MGAGAHLEQRYTTQSAAGTNDINNMSNEDKDSILTNVLINCDREERASGKENCQVRTVVGRVKKVELRTTNAREVEVWLCKHTKYSQQMALISHVEGGKSPHVRMPACLPPPLSAHPLAHLPLRRTPICPHDTYTPACPPCLRWSELSTSRSSGHNGASFFVFIFFAF